MKWMKVASDLSESQETQQRGEVAEHEWTEAQAQVSEDPLRGVWTNTLSNEEAQVQNHEDSEAQAGGFRYIKTRDGVRGP